VSLRVGVIWLATSFPHTHSRKRHVGETVMKKPGNLRKICAKKQQLVFTPFTLSCCIDISFNFRMSNTEY